MDPAAIADLMEQDDFNVSDHVDQLDSNGDGMITAEDCPFEHGSQEARDWWFEVLEPHMDNSITDEMREQYGDDVKGAYKGKPLVPGQAGQDQGDFQLVVDKLRVLDGYDQQSAEKIVSKAYTQKYGG